MCIITSNFVSIFFHSRDGSKNGKRGALKLELNRVIIEIAFKRSPIWTEHFVEMIAFFCVEMRWNYYLSILGTLNLNWRHIDLTKKLDERSPKYNYHNLEIWWEFRNSKKKKKKKIPTQTACRDILIFVLNFPAFRPDKNRAQRKPSLA